MNNIVGLEQMISEMLMNSYRSSISVIQISLVLTIELFVSFIFKVSFLTIIPRSLQEIFFRNCDHPLILSASIFICFVPHPFLIFQVSCLSLFSTSTIYSVVQIPYPNFFQWVQDHPCFGLSACMLPLYSLHFLLYSI
jgi:hypothetical protein